MTTHPAFVLCDPQAVRQKGVVYATTRARTALLIIACAEHIMHSTAACSVGCISFKPSLLVTCPTQAVMHPHLLLMSYMSTHKMSYMSMQKMTQPAQQPHCKRGEACEGGEERHDEMFKT